MDLKFYHIDRIGYCEISSFGVNIINPEKRTGIQKNFHISSPLKEASISSGSGSKNAGVTSNSPLANPKGR